MITAARVRARAIVFLAAITISARVLEAQATDTRDTGRRPPRTLELSIASGSQAMSRTLGGGVRVMRGADLRLSLGYRLPWTVAGARAQVVGALQAGTLGASGDDYTLTTATIGVRAFPSTSLGRVQPFVGVHVGLRGAETQGAIGLTWERAEIEGVYASAELGAALRLTSRVALTLAIDGAFTDWRSWCREGGAPFPNADRTVGELGRMSGVAPRLGAAVGFGRTR